MLWQLGWPEEPLPAEIKRLHKLMAHSFLLVCHCALSSDDAVEVISKGLRLNLCAAALDIA